MAKSKTDKVSEIENPNLSLDSVGYAVVNKGIDYEFVKFNFDIESKTMSEIETVYQGSKFDCLDELVLCIEDETYSS